MGFQSVSNPMVLTKIDIDYAESVYIEDGFASYSSADKHGSEIIQTTENSITICFDEDAEHKEEQKIMKKLKK